MGGLDRAPKDAERTSAGVALAPERRGGSMGRWLAAAAAALALFTAGGATAQTAEDVHAAERARFGFGELRRGADGDANSPYAANSDESKIAPFGLPPLFASSAVPEPAVAGGSVDMGAEAAGLDEGADEVTEPRELTQAPSWPAPSADLVGSCAHGEVHVVSRVVGFKKIKFYTNENVGSGELDLPEQEMHTTAYWLTIPRVVMAALPYAADDRRDGVVGLSFAMRQVAQLLLMCDRHDIGILIGSGEQGEQPDLTRMGQPVTLSDEPRIFVYDNYPGGVGFSEPLFRMDEDLRRRTHELIAGCECQSGCPTCVGPVGNTGPMAKRVALRILELLHTSSSTELGAGPSTALTTGTESPALTA